MRRVLVLAAAIATSIVWISSARAGTIVSNVADGILTVNGTTEGDDVTVRCEGGQVTVNHDYPARGRIASALDDVTLSAFDHLLLQAGTGDDRILGGDGDDFVQAGDGDDELEGGVGDDSLSGGSGNDELSGGRRDDICRGGPGADSFVSC